jgi:CRISPR-associated exonuclease Cas4
MMGDRDYRTTIKNAIDSIGRELEIEIDSDDFKTINLIEVVRCMRRSYYDRTDPKEI